MTDYGFGFASVVSTAGTKQCRDCKKRKPKSEFFESPSRGDKLYPYCKDCCKCQAKKSHDRFKTTTVIEARSKTKPCKKCGEEKSLQEFYRSRETNDGFTNHCRSCLAEQEQTAEIRKSIKDPNKAYCPSCKQKKSKSDFHKNSSRRNGVDIYCRDCSKKKAPDRYFKHTYGITKEEYAAMLKSQKGVCHLCKKPETMIHLGKTARLCVDHCHKTGKIRGLLCNACNHAIGRLEYLLDDDLLEPALQYIRK